MLYCLLYFDVNAKLQIIFEVASIHAEIFDFFRFFPFESFFVGNEDFFWENFRNAGAFS